MRAIRVAIAGMTAIAAALLAIPPSAVSAAPTPAVAGAGGTYYPLAPTRILDTRSGTGAPTGAVGAGGVVHLQVDGVGGVPASGVSAVVLNVTVTGATAASYLTIWPSGGTRPTVSNIDFPAGWTGANGTTVSVGSGGKVDIYNHSGNVQVIADVVGYYASSSSTATPGGQMFPTDPWRLFDSRDDNTPMPSGGSFIEAVDFGSEFNSHIRALAINITVVGPTGSGFLTTWDGQGDPPLASTLNYTTGKTVPNMAIVPTTPCTLADSCTGMPSFGVFNSGATTHVFADVFGVYDDGSIDGGLLFRPINPVRITDTRTGLGGHGSLGAGGFAVVTPPNTVKNENTVALALNVTAVAPTADTYLTLWPAGEPRPATSNLDPAKNATVANTASIPLGDGYAFGVYNHSGTANVLIDVQGAFDFPTTAAAANGARTNLATRSSSPLAVISHHLYRTNG
jgi:hypothetical protein